MATTISTQDIIDAKRDIEDIGKAVNEKVIVSPRYGEDFKSLPMISAEFQISSDAAEAAALSAAGSANIAQSSSQIAQSSANIAEAAATSVTISAGVFETPEAGVDPATGVADGAYYNVRSSSAESYIDEYQNIGGVATSTGKSYPSSAALVDTFVTATAYGSGSIARKQREINAERVSVHDFGAIGDGTLHTVAEWTVEGSRIYFLNLAAIQAVYPHVMALTDSVDWVAIQACINYCRTNGKVATSVAGNTYYINKQIDLNCSAEFKKSTFLAPKNYTGKVVSIDSDSISKNLIGSLNIVLPILTNKSSVGDAHFGAVGVYIHALIKSNIVFDEVYGFETNIKLHSSDTNRYVSYNNFHFTNLISRSKINLHLDVTGSGWINECKWHGGQWAAYAGDTTAHTTTCIKISKTLGGNNPPNGHVFIGCAMESSFTRTIDYDLDPLITTTYFSGNKWIACRFEGAVKFNFNEFALYDSFIGSMINPETVFENSVVPTLLSCTRQFKSSLEGGANIGTTRRSLKTHYFDTLSSGSNMAVAVGLKGKINAAITSSGTFAVFKAAAESLHPIAKVGDRFGNGAISLGNGESETMDTLYWNNVKDWRIGASLSPAVDNDTDLGTSANKYRKVYSVQNIMTGGFGVFGSASPTSKPSVTGLKTPTTIAEQKVVTDSLIAALASYGLITDNRT